MTTYHLDSHYRIAYIDGITVNERGDEMRQIKNFKTAAAQAQWIAKNQHRCQITILFVNNGFAVEYRQLRVIDC